MKKITLLFAFLCFSLLANAQATCNQTFTASGLDNDPTVLTINSTDLTCHGSETITALQLVNGSTPGDCAADGSAWFNFSLSIDNGAPIVGCGTDFNNIDITGFTSLTITSADTDGWAAGDAVTITIDVEVTFTSTTPPSCDSTLTSPVNGDPAAAIDGVIVWSAASGGVTGYNLTVGTSSGGNDVLATTALGNVTTYDLGTLSFGTTYYVTIESFNANGTATGCTEQMFTTYTPVPGDVCAIALPIACGGSESGTTVGATSNDAPTGTCGTGAGAPGVWYSITGNGDLLTASLCGSAYDTKIQVYEGACGTLTCVEGNDDSCNFQSEVSFPTTDGTDYYIYVYGFGTDTGDYTLDVTCTPIENPITTDITTYTPEQLVEDVLIDADCATVTNIQYETHSTGNDIGFSYFTDGGSNFPFENGIILSSGAAIEAAGPFSGNGPSHSGNGIGDADLEAITGVTDTHDRVYLEFDFVPLAPQISFNYIMASTEYNGDDECTFADSFAFILTHVSSGTVTNLAKLPAPTNGNDNVIVTNIHPEVPGFFGCPAENEHYFGGYTLPFGGIAYGGRTVPLTAFSNVIAGDLYHIKLVMADQADSILDTAIFLEGGSFSLGSVDLGDDVFLGDPEALCEGDVTTLNAGVLPNGTEIKWFKDGVEVTGSTMVNPTTMETEQILNIDSTGDYSMSIYFTLAPECSREDEVHIEFYPKPAPDLGDTVIKCAGEALVLNANVGNLTDPNMSLPLEYVWEYRPNATSAWTTISGATPDTYTIEATTVIASTNSSAGAVQYDHPVTGVVTYANVINNVYELGDFRVTATDLVTGCSGTSDVHVDFYENANCMDLPTGLSPNGDGVNDCLVFDDLETLQGVSKFQVFNRYGTKVFENGSYIKEWCGTNDDGDELISGTYYYVLDFEDGRSPIRSWIYINTKN